MMREFEHSVQREKERNERKVILQFFKDNIEPQESEKYEEQHFQTVYKQWKGTKAQDSDVTYKIIPKFYFKVRISSFFQATWKNSIT